MVRSYDTERVLTRLEKKSQKIFEGIRKEGFNNVLGVFIPLKEHIQRKPQVTVSKSVFPYQKTGGVDLVCGEIYYQTDSFYVSTVFEHKDADILLRTPKRFWRGIKNQLEEQIENLNSSSYLCNKEDALRLKGILEKMNKKFDLPADKSSIFDEMSVNEISLINLARKLDDSMKKAKYESLISGAHMALDASFYMYAPHEEERGHRILMATVPKYFPFNKANEVAEVYQPGEETAFDLGANLDSFSIYTSLPFSLGYMLLNTSNQVKREIIERYSYRLKQLDPPFYSGLRLLSKLNESLTSPQILSK